MIEVKLPKLSLNKYLAKKNNQKFLNQHVAAYEKNKIKVNNIVTEFETVHLGEFTGFEVTKKENSASPKPKNASGRKKNIMMKSLDFRQKKEIRLKDIKVLSPGVKASPLNITKRTPKLQHQKTKFLMSKYYPENSHTHRNTALKLEKERSSLIKIKGNKLDKLTYTANILHKPDKKAKSSIPYFIENQSRSPMPNMSSSKYRRRMGVNLGNISEGLQPDAETHGQNFPPLQQSDTKLLFEETINVSMLV